MGTNFFYYWLALMVLSIAFFVFFRFSKNAPLKRTVFPIVTIVTNIFVLFIFWTEFAGEIGWIGYAFTPFMIVSTVSGLRRTGFCDACGAMSLSSSWWSKPAACSDCGSRWI